MFIQGIDGIRHRGVGGGGQYVGGSCRADDVRRMASAGSLGMVSVDRAPGNRVQRILHASALIQRVGVNCDLHIILIGHIQTVVDDCRCGTPVFVNLEAHGSGADLFCESALI